MNKKIYIALAMLIIAGLACSTTDEPTSAPPPVVPTAAPAATVAPTKAPAQPTAAPAATKAPEPTKAPASAVTTLKNKSGSITLDVPSSWTQVLNDDTKLGDIPTARIIASPDLKGYEAYTAPGVEFYASASLAKLGGFIQVLDELRGVYLQDCKYNSKDRYDYADDVFEGKWDGLTDCKGTGNVLVVFSGRPKQQKTSLLVFMVVNFPAPDAKAVDTLKLLLDSFDVTGQLP